MHATLIFNSLFLSAHMSPIPSSWPNVEHTVTMQLMKVTEWQTEPSTKPATVF